MMRPPLFIASLNHCTRNNKPNFYDFIHHNGCRRRTSAVYIDQIFYDMMRIISHKHAYTHVHFGPRVRLFKKRMHACMWARKSLTTALAFQPNKSHTFSPKASFPSTAPVTAPLRSAGRAPIASWPCDSRQLPLRLDAERQRGRREEEGVAVVKGSGQPAGSGRMRENKFLHCCHEDESTAGRGGERRGPGVVGQRADLP